MKLHTANSNINDRIVRLRQSVMGSLILMRETIDDVERTSVA